MVDRVPCPCCGYLTLAALASYLMCEVCYWEDDGAYDLDVASGGPNGSLTLGEGRRNMDRFGASDPRFRGAVRMPRPEEIPEWMTRPLSETPGPDAPVDIDLGWVVVVVVDMPRALAFYRLLGLDIADSADDEPSVEVMMRSGLRLGIETEAVGGWRHPGGRRRGEGSRLGPAFRLPDPATVDAVHARVADAGYVSARVPFDAPWGQRYATVRDPDGTAVDLFAPL